MLFNVIPIFRSSLINSGFLSENEKLSDLTISRWDNCDKTKSMGVKKRPPECVNLRSKESVLFFLSPTC